MNIVKTIDLWTEQFENDIECLSGSFVDGFENGEVPFDSYKVFKNCNCIITTNYPGINISNKHNAIIFNKNGLPVRLMVTNKNTDVDKCIEEILNQEFYGKVLKDIYHHFGIKGEFIDLGETSITNQSNHEMEIDVGSCDRPSLLDSMLEGSYTQNDTGLSKSNSDNKYQFIPDIDIQYDLHIDNNHFIIEHHSAFINESMTRIIPLQKNSLLDIDEISSRYTLSSAKNI